MAPPTAGTYTIRNEATQQWFDLKEKNIQPPSAIIGWPQNGGGNQNVINVLRSNLVQFALTSGLQVGL